MSDFTGLRGLHWKTILLAALSLSIGWGIRGNFGHEYGAMIPGALTAIAVCLMSGRTDWRERVPYFGMFGALGWAFGGSISYMQVIAYTHSGHAVSQYYGFFCLFVIGFLWAGMGGAGTAFPAVADRNRLTEVFRPLCWVFGVWFVLTVFALPAIEHWESAEAATWHRHESPLYWFDSDWIQALTAILAVFLFDLSDRHFPKAPWLMLYALVGAGVGYSAGQMLSLIAPFVPFPMAVPTPFCWAAGVIIGAALFCVHHRLVLWPPLLAGIGAALGYAVQAAAHLAGSPVLLVETHPQFGWIAGMVLGLSAYFWFARKVPWLAVYGIAGAGIGYMIQTILTFTGIAWLLAKVLIQYQGDMTAAREFAVQQSLSFEQVLDGYLINWPQFFLIIPQHLGWMLGLLAGIVLYFRRFGKFRSGSSLFLYMAGGWFVCFLIFPTLLGFGGAGFRMTPPRGDDWAGILGVFLGTLLWLHRQNLIPVIYASMVSGIVGGLGFSGAAWLKLMMVTPGNPSRVSDPAVIEAWRHWQSANWHSFLEQSYGFINGIAIAIALGLLATRTGHVQGDPKQRRWTEVFAAGFVLFLLTFLNIFKNVRTWNERGSVPEMMKMPLFRSIELSASAWFVIVWGFMSFVGLCLLIRHLRRPMALAPASWLGKGQLFYLVFLWMMVTANFERALPSFNEQRILTEGVIFVNAILVTWMILVWPGGEKRVPELGLYNYERAFSWTLFAGVITVLTAAIGMTVSVRAVYGDAHAGHSGLHKRFGADALWRAKPLQKGKEHS